MNTLKRCLKHRRPVLFNIKTDWLSNIPARLPAADRIQFTRNIGFLSATGFVLAFVYSQSCASEEQKSLSLQMLIGSTLYSRDLAAGANSDNKEETIVDAPQFIGQIGVAGWLENIAQIGLQIQLNEDLKTGVISDFQLQPFIAWQQYESINLSIGLILAPITEAANRFSFGIQPAVGTNWEIIQKLDLTLSVQLPVILDPEPKFQISPLIGFTYDM